MGWWCLVWRLEVRGWARGRGVVSEECYVGRARMGGGKEESRRAGVGYCKDSFLYPLRYSSNAL